MPIIRSGALLLTLSWNLSLAQAPPISRLETLAKQYKARTLGDTPYLKAVDSLAPVILNEDSLRDDLQLYQQIAFKATTPGRFRMRYYRYLSLQAVSKNRYGSAIYYSEKTNEEGIKAGIYDKNTLSHGDLFTLSVYCTDMDFGRAFAKYDSLRPRIFGMVTSIPRGKVTPEDADVAISILHTLAVGAYQAKDTPHLEEAAGVSRELLDQIDLQPARYKEYHTFYESLYHCNCFMRYKNMGRIDSAQAMLETALDEVTSPGFLAQLQPYYTFDFYAYAFDFFIKTGRRDSAARYLGLAKALQVGLVENTSMKTSFILDGSAKLEALQGDYRNAYTNLRMAYEPEDSSLNRVSSDRDNNLYALAEAENTRTELVRKEEEGKRMGQFNVALFAALVILIVVILSGYFVVTSRSKQRMLSLRLGLARNFHDEIGPMLLYAGTLVKKETEENASLRLEELRGHLAHVMEAVRGITHDLKSSEFSTVVSFVKEVTLLLEKIRGSTGIDFNIRHQNRGRILSHFQHTHLGKVISELISNSIKHSGCSSIHIAVNAAGRYLHIHYTDNGKGMAPRTDNGGIGLQNVRERVGLLNGTFKLQNAHPEGYSIDLKIPLL
jgi:signal transduction histidine kinase